MKLTPWFLCKFHRMVWHNFQWNDWFLSYMLQQYSCNNQFPRTCVLPANTKRRPPTLNVMFRIGAKKTKEGHSYQNPSPPLVNCKVTLDPNLRLVFYKQNMFHLKHSTISKTPLNPLGPVWLPWKGILITKFSRKINFKLSGCHE